MKPHFFKTIAISLCSFMLFNSQANAQTYTHTSKAGENYAKHDVTLINDYNTNNFSASFTRNTTDCKLDSSGWLVLSDGPHPNKNEPKQHTQLVFDFDKNVISAFTYIPDTMQNNYKQGKFLGKFNNAITFGINDKSKVNFKINTTEINRIAQLNNGTGINFKDTVGAWFKTTGGSKLDYDCNGKLIHYKGGRTNQVVDFSNGKTTISVSEPMGVFVALSALGLFLSVRRKKPTIPS